MTKERLKFVAILLSVPLAGLLVFHLVLSSYDASWLEALRAAYPKETTEKLRSFRLEAACNAPDKPGQLSSLCFDHRAVSWLRSLSLFVLVFSILLPILVHLAGRVCRSNRELLLRLFKPGLKLALASVVVLVPLEALILIGVIWFGESALVHRVHAGMILMLAFAGLGGAYSIVKVALSSGHSATAHVRGIPATRHSAPTLWRNVDEWAKEVGTAPPAQIILGDDPTYFVTEAPVVHSEGTAEGRTLYLSAPLSRILSVEELRAIVFHELGHFHGSDTEYSLKFFPIYRGAADSLQELSFAASNAGNGGLALIPTLHLLSFFLESFAEAENSISRERELAADQFAAGHGGARNAASSLVKVIAFSNLWEKATGTFFEYPNAKVVETGHARYPADEFLSNPSAMFVRMATEASSPELLKGIDEQRLPHPIDSHPPLAARLEAWGVSLQEIEKEALNPTPASPATALIDNLAETEQKLAELLRRSLPEMVIEPPSFRMLEEN